MKEIHVTVREGRAFQTDNTVYLTGDGEFWVVFELEDSWEDYPAKVARFQTELGYQDVLFRGNRCPVPAFRNARKLEVGLYAGDIRTTTPARIFVRQGIRSLWGPPVDPAPSLFDQLMESLGESDLRLEQTPEGPRLTLCYRGGEKSVLLENNEVYVGAGEMPKGYWLQLDPSGGETVLKIRGKDGNVYTVSGNRGEKGEKGDKGDAGRDSTTSVNGRAPDENGNITLTARDVGALSTQGGSLAGALQMGGCRVTGLGTPQEDTDGASKGYVDGKHLSFTVRLPGASGEEAGAWQGNGPFTLEIASGRLLASDNPHLCPVFSDEPDTARKQMQVWQKISLARTEDGKLIFVCLEELPETIPLDIFVEVNR